MKKILLFVVLLSTLVIFGGCFSSGGPALEEVRTEDAPDAAKVKMSSYTNNLVGLEKYLTALGYIPEKAEPQQLMCSVIGAKDGDRFNFKVDGAVVYVELFEYDTDKLNDEAKRVIGEVEKDGEYYVFGENANVNNAAYEASLSANKKYLVSYTVNSNDEVNVKRKEDFINAVKNFDKTD